MMAIADDFSVAANGDIRWTGTTANYTVLQLHRFLQDLADDPSSGGDDIVDITSDTPSDRSTDNIITLLGDYNIDDTAAEHLYAGSITQSGGDTVYSGLQVLGAVNDTSTQLMVIQDNSIYQFTPDPVNPFWGIQEGGGYNGNAAAGILMRCMIKTRTRGADIDAKRIRVQARHWQDTYDFFNVTLGQGESVAAIGTTPDAQNDSEQADVTNYSHVSNTEGYQNIDLNNGAGPRPYYSQWTFGADPSSLGLKGIWEYIKDYTGTGTSKVLYNTPGELFLGITHDVTYTDENNGPFVENEKIVWGTEIGYDNSVGTVTFESGDYVTFIDPSTDEIVNAGKVVWNNNDGGNMWVALEDLTGGLIENDFVIERVRDNFNQDISVGAIDASAQVDVSIFNDTKGGGEGRLLALNDAGTTGNLYIQLLTGTAPSSIPLRGLTSNADASSGTTTSRTIPKTFLGSYTGSLIGAYGIGVASSDLTATDTIEDLIGVTQTPPNNVTFTVTGLVVGEDRLLVGPRAAGILDKGQQTLATTLSGAAETLIYTTTNIPTDTPTSGTIRVEVDTSIFRYQAYTSYDASAYTIAARDYSGIYTATAGTRIFISYLDLLATSTSESFTSVYLADRDLFVRDRDGGATPIKTFEAPATLGSGGGTIAVIRTSDL